jgi:hypothetical protein
MQAFKESCGKRGVLIVQVIDYRNLGLSQSGDYTQGPAQPDFICYPPTSNAGNSLTTQGGVRKMKRPENQVLPS